MTTKQEPGIVDKLVVTLSADKEYYYGWQSNIACEFISAYRKQTKKKGYLNAQELHKIANDAAKGFLNLLIKAVANKRQVQDSEQTLPDANQPQTNQRRSKGESEKYKMCGRMIGHLECDCGRRIPAPLAVKDGDQVICPMCQTKWQGVAESNAPGFWTAVAKDV
jgi:hypothetical protein